MVRGQYGRRMAAKRYGDTDPHVLKALPNPRRSHRTQAQGAGVTFLGARAQPDFGTLYVTFYPGETAIELKSLKGTCISGVIPPSHTSGSSTSYMTT